METGGARLQEFEDSEGDPPAGSEELSAPPAEPAHVRDAANEPAAPGTDPAQEEGSGGAAEVQHGHLPANGGAVQEEGDTPSSEHGDDADDERRQRENVRVNVQFPVTVRLEGHEEQHCRSRNVSATGIGFSTRLPVENDARGAVTVHFPEWDFTKDVHVRFVKPIIAGRQVGAAFEELTPDERERLVKQVFAVQREQLQVQRQEKQ